MGTTRKEKMRYCDKCGCAITSGGHKSAASGLFVTPYLCDECYAAECDGAAKAVGFFARIFIGLLAGVATTGGVFFLLSKTAANDLSNDTQMKIAIGVEVIAIICFIASKIGSRILGSKALRFLCGVVAYFSFWMSLVFGIGMYFILKYA